MRRLSVVLVLAAVVVAIATAAALLHSAFGDIPAGYTETARRGAEIRAGWILVASLLAAAFMLERLSRRP